VGHPGGGGSRSAPRSGPPTSPVRWRRGIMAEAAASAAAATQQTPLPSPSEMAGYITKQCDADLAFIFSESGLALEWQYRIVAAGFTTARRFAGFEETRAAVRDALRTTLQLDPAAGIEQRLQAAMAVDAWETARETHRRITELKAEARVTGQVRPVAHSERTAMRRVVEQTHGKLPPEEIPSASYISLKLEEVEQDEPQAAPLDEITNMEDATDLDLTLGVDATGAFKAIRRKVKVSMPANSEQLRRRLRVEANLWLFMATKFTNRAWLQGLTRNDFDRYTDHVLGKKVAAIQIGAPGGADSAPLRPPWSLVLAFEHQLRKKAFASVRDDGKTLADALRDACGDSELKELHFTTPLALAPRALKRGSGDVSADQGNPNADPWAANIKNKWGKPGKGKSKSKGGKGKGGGKGVVSRTADNRLICFAYNNPSESCNGECGMAHICRTKGCGAAHPVYQCPLAATSASPPAAAATK
jgi:hypothetical protein